MISRRAWTGNTEFAEVRETGARVARPAYDAVIANYKRMITYRRRTYRQDEVEDRVRSPLGATTRREVATEPWDVRAHAVPGSPLGRVMP